MSLLLQFSDKWFQTCIAYAFRLCKVLAFLKVLVKLATIVEVVSAFKRDTLVGGGLFVSTLIFRFGPCNDDIKKLLASGVHLLLVLLFSFSRSFLRSALSISGEEVGCHNVCLLPTSATRSWKATGWFFLLPDLKGVWHHFIPE